MPYTLSNIRATFTFADDPTTGLKLFSFKRAGSSQTWLNFETNLWKANVFDTLSVSPYSVVAKTPTLATFGGATVQTDAAGQFITAVWTALPIGSGDAVTVTLTLRLNASEDFLRQNIAVAFSGSPTRYAVDSIGPPPLAVAPLNSPTDIAAMPNGVLSENPIRNLRYDVSNGQTATFANGTTSNTWNYPAGRGWPMGWWAYYEPSAREGWMAYVEDWSLETISCRFESDGTNLVWEVFQPQPDHVLVGNNSQTLGSGYTFCLRPFAMTQVHGWWDAERHYKKRFEANQPSFYVPVKSARSDLSATEKGYGIPVDLSINDSLHTLGDGKPGDLVTLMAQIRAGLGMTAATPIVGTVEAGSYQCHLVAETATGDLRSKLLDLYDNHNCKMAVWFPQIFGPGAGDFIGSRQCPWPIERWHQNLGDAAELRWWTSNDGPGAFRMSRRGYLDGGGADRLTEGSGGYERERNFPIVSWNAALKELTVTGNPLTSGFVDNIVATYIPASGAARLCKATVTTLFSNRIKVATDFKDSLGNTVVPLNTGTVQLHEYNTVNTASRCEHAMVNAAAFLTRLTNNSTAGRVDDHGSCGAYMDVYSRPGMSAPTPDYDQWCYRSDHGSWSKIDVGYTQHPLGGGSWYCQAVIDYVTALKAAATALQIANGDVPHYDMSCEDLDETVLGQYAYGWRSLSALDLWRVTTGVDPATHGYKTFPAFPTVHAGRAFGRALNQELSSSALTASFPFSDANLHATMGYWLSEWVYGFTIPNLSIFETNTIPIKDFFDDTQYDDYSPPGAISSRVKQLRDLWKQIQIASKTWLQPYLNGDFMAPAAVDFDVTDTTTGLSQSTYTTAYFSGDTLYDRTAFPRVVHGVRKSADGSVVILFENWTFTDGAWSGVLDLTGYGLPAAGSDAAARMRVRRVAHDGSEGGEVTFDPATGTLTLDVVDAASITTVVLTADAPLAVLENDRVSVRFDSDPIYKVVLTSITNLDDGSVQSFEAGPLIRAIVRPVGTTDSFTTLEPGITTTVAMNGTFSTTSPLVGPTDSLGQRESLQITFVFPDVFGGSSDDLTAIFVCSLLESQPDRPLFQVGVNWDLGGASNGAVFWLAPVLLKMAPHDAAHYMIPVNGGLTTRDPNVDLVGNGTDYRFNTAMGFEPETKAAIAADRMEVFYPEKVSSALSAYGNRATIGTTVYLHDELAFRGCRILDGFVDGSIRLEHETLIQNGITAYNGLSVPIANASENLVASRYVRVFKRTGAILGEDVGLDYRRWVLSSAEGMAMLPAKQKDRADMATIALAPLAVTFHAGDDELETGLSDDIAAELRLFFPGFGDSISRLRLGDDGLLAFQLQNGSATHSGLVGDSVPDLFDVSVDAAKIAQANLLRAAPIGMQTGGSIFARRPTPYDGAGFWTSDSMDAARVKNHLEAAIGGSYKTTDQWLKVQKTVNSRTYNATTDMTRLVLNAGAFDPSLWEIFSTYALTSAGINHALHTQHLGWLKHTSGAAYAFTVERQVQADFIHASPKIYVAGDQTATILATHVIDIFFQKLAFVPGYDKGVAAQVGDNATTSLCGMADDIGQGLASPTSGWAVRLFSEIVLKDRVWSKLVQFKAGRENLICWSNHGTEIPGSNAQLLAWRRILSVARSGFAQPFQLSDDYGPYDWQVGLVDGYSKTQVRLDLTTGVGSWGASPFFQTAWGSFQRAGFYGNNDEGHVSNAAHDFGTYAELYEGILAAAFREALVSDWMLGKLPTYGASPVLADSLGTVSGGVPGFTPFAHASYGIGVSASLAALLARLMQVALTFEQVNLLGQRARSLERAGAGFIAYNPIVAGSTGLVIDGHDLPATEDGPERPPLFHVVLRHPTDPRKLYAVFVNDGTSRRGDSFNFVRAWYEDTVPMGTDGFSLTRYVVNVDGVTAADPLYFAQDAHLSISLDAGEVTVLLFDFSSGLRFQYAYDDEELREVPVANDKTRIRVEDIHGSGAKMIFGFRNDLPDQDFKIAAVDLRVIGQGQSEVR